MDGDSAVSTLGLLIQILTLDLLLSGDNALVIAIACRRLPPEKAQLAAWLGAAGAIFMRFVLTATAGALMSLPFLQMASAFPLIVIALHLMAGDDDDSPLRRGGGASDLMAAAGMIILSDAAMSIDNVVALAAVAGGNVWLLLIGFLISVPLIVFGSFGFGRLIKLFPWLIDVGGALLGWIAGGLVVKDPVIAPWAAVQAPALQLTLPLAGAIFVLVQGRVSRKAAQAADLARDDEVFDQEPVQQGIHANVPATVEEAAQNNVAPADELTPKAASESMQESIEALAEALTRELAAAPPERVAEPTASGPVEAAPKPVIASEPVMASEPVIAPEPVMASEPDFTPAEPTGTEAGDHGDRIMLIGLAALFLVFGLFLALFIAIPE